MEESVNTKANASAITDMISIRQLVHASIGRSSQLNTFNCGELWSNIDELLIIFYNYDCPIENSYPNLSFSSISVGSSTRHLIGTSLRYSGGQTYACITARLYKTKTGPIVMDALWQVGSANGSHHGQSDVLSISDSIIYVNVDNTNKAYPGYLQVYGIKYGLRQ